MKHRFPKKRKQGDGSQKRFGLDRESTNEQQQMQEIAETKRGYEHCYQQYRKMNACIILEIKQGGKGDPTDWSIL
jgi:hypothetical protein